VLVVPIPSRKKAGEERKEKKGGWRDEAHAASITTPHRSGERRRARAVYFAGSASKYF
jgi:hypothetical protein